MAAAPGPAPVANADLPVVRARPGRWWRVLQFPVTRLLLAGAAVMAWTSALQRAATAIGIEYGSAPGLAFGVLLCASVLALYASFVRLVEGRAVVELSPAGAARRFGAGALAGGALFAGTMLVLWLAGAWRLTGHAAGPRVVLAQLVAALVAGCVEEVLLRGVLFRIVEESLGSWLALALSALVFGLMHAFNPGAGVVSTLAIALEAGVLLAAAYMLSRRLWTVIGLHAAWNFTEGGVFGPEASLVAVLLCLGAGVALALLARRRGLVVRPRWRRA